MSSRGNDHWFLPDIKRIVDLLLSVTFLILCCWLLLPIVFAIKITSKGPVIYFSKRVGLGGGIYFMPKFRTMKVDTPEVATDLLKSPDTHITRVGRFLRKTSLDEMPQLWSVLVGDMSIVGPRPALDSQTDLTRKRMNLGILSLRPGITGWAQINGRDMIDDDEKIKLDLFYLEHRSTIFDAKIIMVTILRLFYDHEIRH